MIRSYRFRRGTLVVPLLFLCACTASRWDYDSVDTSTHSSERSYYTSKEIRSPMDIEFIDAPHGQYLYLNLSGTPLPNATCTVDVGIEGSTTTYQANVLAGGQRVLLPQEATTLIFQTLERDCEVTLTVAGISTTLVKHKTRWEQFCNLLP